ncbi:glutamine amidotransferase [Halomonas sp. 18H]|uniref:glutamine amidotransferase n=1 Tax=Halomonas almeriensis TaxID=308163 RepID=UPI002231D56C|nr:MULTISPECIES: glutamine amidotransferase [Halomonas]MCW4149279.1 glutamine amidotransferase [Halomonas sp. 18H]MDN3552168.1 glutamine amidotransferase [Halomonas almeriensis]
MKLWIIKTGDAFADVVAEYGDFEHFFLNAMKPVTEACPALELAVYDARHDGTPPQLAQGDGLVITGSHAMVSHAEAWSEALKPWLVDAWQRNLPMLGVCYGHQLMAAALGGESGFHPAGRKSGTYRVELTQAVEADPLFGALPRQLAVQLTHAQSVLQPPACAAILGHNGHDPYQALRYGPRQWSVQFHPEFTAPVMRFYLGHQRQVLTEQGQDPEHLIEGVTETPEATSLLSRFARLVASGETVSN